MAGLRNFPERRSCYLMDPARTLKTEPQAAAEAAPVRTPEQNRILDEVLAELFKGQPPPTQEELDAIVREWSE